MRKFMIVFMSVWLAGSVSFSFSAAEQAVKKPLNEVFDQLVIIPYDYQGKAFINGAKIDLTGDYEIVQKDGRVLVPIRLMSSLATDVSQGYWEANWQPDKPDDVILINYHLQKTIKFTVNSKTMMVNKQPQILDVAPQRINGRIMLPLRSAAVALGTNIDWLDGMILMGSPYVDLQHPQTLAIKDRIKVELVDKRKPVNYTNTVSPITMHNNAVYYTKSLYKQDRTVIQLYRKVEGQKEILVDLTGEPLEMVHEIINGELYYVSNINDQSELHAYNFANQTSRKICILTGWSLRDGWIRLEHLDNELYINLHTGDNTMGSDHVYKVVQGQLQSVTTAKDLIDMERQGDYLYKSDFKFMSGPADNLSRLDTRTGETMAIGQPGFAYGITRTIDEQGTSWGAAGDMYIKDGYLYTLAYQESNLEDTSAVYKVNLSNQSQVKMSSPANDFWMLNNLIYYIDSNTGYLKSLDLDGNNDQVLVERKVSAIQFYEGKIYYTSNSNSAHSLGELYQYDIVNQHETKLSDKVVSTYAVGKTGVYYVSEGYDLGLYKTEADGKNIRLIKDSIDTALLTDEGMVYTLVYKEGIYSVK
jgi:hypothetical protein